MPDRVLFDINVILDVLEYRNPHVMYSGPIIEMASTGRISGFLSASSVDTLFYLIRAKEGATEANRIISTFMTFLSIAGTNQLDINQAIESGWSDLEDAIVYYSAKSAGCSYVITRNARHFKSDPGGPLVMTPQEYGKIAGV